MKIARSASPGSMSPFIKVGIKYSCSHETVRKLVRRSASNPNGIYPYKTQKKMRITGKQKQKRLNYLNALPSNRHALMLRLKRRIIYDEKPFELGKQPNRQNCRQWRESAGDVDEFPNDKYPTKIHVMAAVSYYGKSKLHWYLKKSKFVKGN